MGYGRDAADVALTTSYGALTLLRMQVWAEAVGAAALLEKTRESSQQQLLGAAL